ncbi:MAG: hypothetical protein AMJ78_07815 [Omnitrophica WOR_2 bacterium SM23_29]|nr:MAG: hypothetical protein AMJ78_07815 [Omnitrophica WOR_2 bacterium SM23_29]
MKVIYGLENFKELPKKIVVAIGIFDGVHLGHKSIIESAIKRAKTLKGKSAVITFKPHPLKVLQPNKPIPLLMSTTHRIRLIDRLGVDLCLVLKFNKRLSNLSPRHFINKILIDKFKASEICVGSDFIFGKNGSGNVNLLKKFGRRYGFKVSVIPMVRIGGRTVSSTLIRNLVMKGRFKEASRMLGRPVTIFGTVVKGAHRGKILGYPTANIDPHHEAIPPSGVYAVRVRLKKKRYGGALFIGKRRTFGESEPVIEAHIFSFSSLIYGEHIEVEFVKKLREAKKFPSHQELVEQIKKDDIAIRKILSRLSFTF